jgi:hypothetical protein
MWYSLGFFMVLIHQVLWHQVQLFKMYDKIMDMLTKVLYCMSSIRDQMILVGPDQLRCISGKGRDAQTGGFSQK